MTWIPAAAAALLALAALVVSLRARRRVRALEACLLHARRDGASAPGGASGAPAASAVSLPVPLAAALPPGTPCPELPPEPPPGVPPGLPPADSPPGILADRRQEATSALEGRLRALEARVAGVEERGGTRRETPPAAATLTPAEMPVAASVVTPVAAPEVAEEPVPAAGPASEVRVRDQVLASGYSEVQVLADASRPGHWVVEGRRGGVTVKGDAVVHPDGRVDVRYRTVLRAFP